MLIGRLGKDPEIRYTQAGNAVANFSLATSDRWTDKQGQKQERTEWHNIQAWDKLADLVQSYLQKGSLIYLEGSLKTSSWDDSQTGQKRYKTEIVAKVIQFLDTKSESQHEQASPAPKKQENSYPQEPPTGGSYINDDMPFAPMF